MIKHPRLKEIFEDEDLEKGRNHCIAIVRESMVWDRLSAKKTRKRATMSDYNPVDLEALKLLTEK